MGGIVGLEVVPFTRDRILNPYPSGELPWQLYHGVRNAVVQTCRKYGPTGPMGVVRIDETVADPYRQTFAEQGFWERGDPNPSYYVIPDQPNDERYLYAELYGDDPFTPAWLADIAATLRGFVGWGLALGNIPESYALIFGDRVMVKGSHLSRCKDTASVVTVVRQLLAGGKAQ
jgi:hypothetical protein